MEVSDGFVRKQRAGGPGCHREGRPKEFGRRADEPERRALPLVHVFMEDFPSDPFA
jgi:hypothetical protein